MRILLLIFCISCSNKVIEPLTNAHAHNDYEHDRPLFDALDNGFTSVEADVHMIDGKLYVSHDIPESLSQVKTLEELYLSPLLKHVNNNNGRVYENHNGFFYLMIDIKTLADYSYPVLRKTLAKYSEMISVVTDSIDQDNKPIKIFISGHHGRPFTQLLNDSIKYAGLDGRPKELKDNIPSALMPVISQNYKKYLTWKGTGNPDENELESLKEMIDLAHDQNKMVRLWAAPDKPVVWDLLLKTGIDFINTDDLEGLREFLVKRN